MSTSSEVKFVEHDGTDTTYEFEFNFDGKRKINILTEWKVDPNGGDYFVDILNPDISKHLEKVLRKKIPRTKAAKGIIRRDQSTGEAVMEWNVFRKPGPNEVIPPDASYQPLTGR
jgi:hypothetical protein